MTPRDVLLAWVDAFNRRDAAGAAALYHADAVNHQVAAGPAVVGRDAIRAGLVAFFAAFPDNTTAPVNVLESGEWVALEWDGTGTWLGPFAGHEPTGRSYRLSGCGFFRVEAGLIVFQRGYWDRLTWFEQIGLPTGDTP